MFVAYVLLTPFKVALESAPSLAEELPAKALRKLQLGSITREALPVALVLRSKLNSILRVVVFPPKESSSLAPSDIGEKGVLRAEMYFRV